MAGTGILAHSGFGLRAGPAIPVSISLCRNWGPLEPSVRTLAFGVPGRVVAVGRLDGMVELWAWQEGARLAAFPAHQDIATALFLRAGCQLLTAGGRQGQVTERAGGV